MENTTMNPEDFPHYGYVPARNNNFVLLSLIMGILSLCTCALIIPPFIFGGLAILFALLSRGKDTNFPKQSLAGIATGALGLILAVCLGAFSIYTLMTNPEYHQLLNDTSKQMYGITFDEILDGKTPTKNIPYEYGEAL